MGGRGLAEVAAMEEEEEKEERFFPSSAALFGRNGKSSTNREAKIYIFFYTIFFPLALFKRLD